ERRPQRRLRIDRAARAPRRVERARRTPEPDAGALHEPERRTRLPREIGAIALLARVDVPISARAPFTLSLTLSLAGSFAFAFARSFAFTLARRRRKGDDDIDEGVVDDRGGRGAMRESGGIVEAGEREVDALADKRSGNDERHAFAVGVQSARRIGE